MVRFNGERIKLYDNNKLTIVDAALQAGFPNEDLFPKRGKELTFTVNGATRIVRGEPGEAAMIYMNGKPENINTLLVPNSEIIIEPSTAGSEAVCTLEELEESADSSMIFIVNGQRVRCPKFLEVNESLELPSYQIKEGDRIESRNFYTVGQLIEFMDVELDKDRDIVVNNRVAELETLIYENFTIDWTVLSFGTADFSYVPDKPQEEMPAEAETAKEGEAEEKTAEDGSTEAKTEEAEVQISGEVEETAEAAADAAAEVATEAAADTAAAVSDETATNGNADAATEAGTETSEMSEATSEEPETEREEVSEADELQKGISIVVYINGQPVRLTGKDSYIFVDIFDFYEFDLSQSKGRAVITNLNGKNAVYTAQLNAGDRIELGWQER